jgi:hypothetical protein
MASDVTSTNTSAEEERQHIITQFGLLFKAERR